MVLQAGRPKGKKLHLRKTFLLVGSLRRDPKRHRAALKERGAKIGVNWLVYTHTGEIFLICININPFFESRALMIPFKTLPASNFYYPTLGTKSQGRFIWRHTVWDLSWGDRHMHLLIPDRQPTADQSKNCSEVHLDESVNLLKLLTGV